MLDAQDMRDVFQIALDRGDEFLDEMSERFAPGGVSYWDEQFASEADFVAWYLDMQTYPSPQNSVLMYLKLVAPDLYQQAETRYRRAAPQMIGVA